MTLDERLYEAFDLLAKERYEQVEREIIRLGIDDSMFSDRFKQKMNKLFREHGADIPYPEVEL